MSRAAAAILILSVSAFHGGRVESQGTAADPTLSADDVLAVLRGVGRRDQFELVVGRGRRSRRADSRRARPRRRAAHRTRHRRDTARSAAMFSNAEAPLSTRTVRFISGIHFPPGVPNTPNAALYGIENTNRGCQLNAADTHAVRARRDRSPARGWPAPAAACRPSDTSRMRHRRPDRDQSSPRHVRAGFSTGKERRARSRASRSTCR